MRARRRRTISLCLQNKHRCLTPLVDVTGLAESEVTAATHARVGVIDCDVGGVVSVEGDPDFEGLGEVVWVEGYPGLVCVDGA